MGKADGGAPTTPSPSVGPQVHSAPRTEVTGSVLCFAGVGGGDGGPGTREGPARRSAPPPTSDTSAPFPGAASPSPSGLLGSSLPPSEKSHPCISPTVLTIPVPRVPSPRPAGPLSLGVGWAAGRGRASLRSPSWPLCTNREPPGPCPNLQHLPALGPDEQELPGPELTSGAQTSGSEGRGGPARPQSPGRRHRGEWEPGHASPSSAPRPPEGCCGATCSWGAEGRRWQVPWQGAALPTPAPLSLGGPCTSPGRKQASTPAWHSPSSGPPRQPSPHDRGDLSHRSPHPSGHGGLCVSGRPHPHLCYWTEGPRGPGEWEGIP